MSEHKALYEAMRRAAADSQNAAIRTRKAIGLASGGLALILAATFFLLNVGPHSVATSLPAAEAASHPQTTVVAPPVAAIASVGPKVVVARKVPATTTTHRLVSAKRRHRHRANDEESADN
jgi:hypothetical protein